MVTVAGTPVWRLRLLDSERATRDSDETVIVTYNVWPTLNINVQYIMMLYIQKHLRLLLQSSDSGTQWRPVWLLMINVVR